MMHAYKAADIREHILKKYAEEFSSIGIEHDAVSDDYDLMDEGIIDSLGLIELIGDIEKKFSLKIDFEDLDADQMTIIGPFCRYVEENGEPIENN